MMPRANIRDRWRRFRAFGIPRRQHRLGDHSRREIATVLLLLLTHPPSLVSFLPNPLVSLIRNRKPPRNAFMAAIKARFLAYEEDRLIRRADEAVKRKVRGETKSVD